MAAKGERLDKIAPIPYVRDKEKRDYEVPTTKFEYYYDSRTVKEITKEVPSTDGTNTVTERYSEITIEKKSRKVYLKTYGHSDREDTEHFFEAWAHFQTELKDQLEEISTAKTNQAQTLFKGFDKMLTGVANADWSTIAKGSWDHD